MRFDVIFSIDPNGFMLTVDPFYSPETFLSAKPDFKKPSKKDVTNKTDESTIDLVSKIKRVDLSDYRIKDLTLYRQIIQDTLSLCEEEIISPYISQNFSLYDVNKAVKFIKEKKCTGKILIDLESDERSKSDDDEEKSDSEEKSKKND